ncbi:MAG: aminopeptidase P family protein [Defluviitaleaceae bacterium]|nr:aminopeptidase P family protein [Defluviitaleaceae bacterium]
MDKLQALRGLMKERGIDAYVITNGDPHSSGYVAGHWKARTWFSGFTGSNGTVVVTHNQVGLWTDGRYFIQAEQELSGTGITLFKMDTPGTPKYDEYLAKELPHGGKLGFDGRVMTMKAYEELAESLKAKEITYVYTEDIIGLIWDDRPALPGTSAFEHIPRFAGLPAKEKLAAVRDNMAKHDLTAYLAVALDDIAWLMNIRGHDMPFAPVVNAYALITTGTAHIFIDRSKVATLAANLEVQGFSLHDYDEIAGFLSNLPTEGKLVYNPEKTNMLLIESLPKGLPTKSDLPADIIMMLKAVKSDIELSNSRNAYIKESAVLVRAIKWLMETPDISALKESDVAKELTRLRTQQPDFLQDAFSTIAAYGPNAALAHYSPGPVGSSLKPDGFFLIDTGGNYLDGTTDTTRTLAVGQLTPEMKRHFTLVLKGYLAVVRTVFPKGMTGMQLDALARTALWEHGLDFRHGTGHGIGYCLCVHEGPQGMSPKSKIEFEPGMLLSVEPGYYEAGAYGIRTENIVEVYEHSETEYGKFYGFKPLMYCPIDKTAIDIEQLNKTEICQLNEYHKMTYDLLAPKLTEDERAWLYEATRPI